MIKIFKRIAAALRVDFRRPPIPKWFGRDGDRYLLWPIGLQRRARAVRRGRRAWSVSWHGWQVGFEEVPFEYTSVGCMPGFRGVYGQTLHLGPVLITLGPRDGWRNVHVSGSHSMQDVERRRAEYHRAVEAGETPPLQTLPRFRAAAARYAAEDVN